MTIEQGPGNDEPGYDCEVVSTTTIAADYTPTDARGRPVLTRAIAFGTAGAIKYVTPAGSTVTIPSGVLLPGLIHAFRASKLISSGSTVAGGVVVWT